MRRLLALLSLIAATILVVSSCDAPAGNNAASGNANKPANNAANAAPANSAAAEAEIKKTLDDFAAALNKGDADGLAKFYRDDYVLIDQDGVAQTKASRIEAIKSGRVKMEGLKFENLKFKVNPAGDAAVVTGHATGKNTIDGKVEDRNSMVTWVIVKEKDKGWQFINAQVTDIKAGAAKPDDKAKADDKEKAPASQPANK